jgi:hypothetical protein
MGMTTPCKRLDERQDVALQPNFQASGARRAVLRVLAIILARTTERAFGSSG